MYQVGSKLGTTYEDEQGIGLAYTGQAPAAGPSAGPSALSAAMTAEAKKQSDIAEAYKRLQTNVPEYWVAFDKGLNSRKDELLAEGAALMAYGKVGTDVLGSFHPEALAYQKKYTTFVSDAKQSIQLKLWDSDNRNMAKSEYGKFTDESIEQVINFPYRNSQEAILSGEIPLPSLILKAPAANTYEAISTLANSVKIKDGVTPAFKDFLGPTVDFMNSSKQSIEVMAFAQQYASLPAEDQEVFKNMAIEAGLKGTADGAIVVMVAQGAADRFAVDPFDYGAAIAGIAAKAPIKETVIGSENKGIGVTTTTESVINVDAYAKLNAGSQVALHWASLSKNETFLKSSGADDLALPLQARMQKAEDYIAQAIKNQVALNYKRVQTQSADAAGRAASEETRNSFMARLRSPVKEESLAAANELKGLGDNIHNGFKIKGILSYPHLSSLAPGLFFFEMDPNLDGSGNPIIPPGVIDGQKFLRPGFGDRVVKNQVYKVKSEAIPGKKTTGDRYFMFMSARDKEDEGIIMRTRYGNDKPTGYDFDQSNPMFIPSNSGSSFNWDN